MLLENVYFGIGNGFIGVGNELAWKSNFNC